MKDVTNIELDGIDGVKYQVSSATRKSHKYCRTRSIKLQFDPQ